MKSIYQIFLFIILPFISYSQNEATFYEIPQNYQLYARDDNNKATMTVSGKINGYYTDISLLVYKNEKLHYYKKIKTASEFKFEPLLDAELSKYSIKVYLYHSSSPNDSLYFNQRIDILCGDVYIFHGQSNAILDGGAHFNNFARSYGKSPLEKPYSLSPTFLDTFTNSIESGIGKEIIAQILENNKVPVCSIVGAAYGANINFFLQDNTDPALNPSENLAYKVRNAGFYNKIKGIIWWQGESNTDSTAIKYDKDFDILYRKWQNDFGTFKKMYVMQTNILKDNASIGTVREKQRQFLSKYPNVEVFATVGLAEHDGLHYKLSGYKQAGQEVYRMINKDFYSGAANIQFKSPNVQKVVYANPIKTRVAIFFEEGQNIVWTEEISLKHSKTGQTYKSQLKKHFYDNKTEIPINSGKAIKNMIVLDFTQPITTQKISYLPDWYLYDGSEIFQGPYLKNALGMRALTFRDVAIEPQPVTNSPKELKTTPLSTGNVQLNWNKNTTEDVKFVIERSIGDSLNFKPIATVANTEYIDNTHNIYLKLYYRVMNSGIIFDSHYSNMASVTPVLLANEVAQNLIIYPNPSQDFVVLELPNSLSKWSGKLFKIDGTSIFDFSIPNGQSLYQLPINLIPTGIYIINIANGETVLRKKIEIIK